MKRVTILSLFFLIGLVALVAALGPDDGCYSESGQEIVCTNGLGQDMVYNQYTGQLTYNLEAGWNVIPANATLVTTPPEGGGLFYQGSNCPADNRYAFIYSPTHKKYLSESAEDQQLISEDISAGYYYAEYGGSWIYVPENCKISVNLAATGAEGNVLTGENVNRKISAGWNFITFMPWMKGKRFRTLLGDCDIENFNVWNSLKQDWLIPIKPSAEIISATLTNEVIDSSIGSTFLIKSSNDCELLSSTPESPPQIPDY